MDELTLLRSFRRDTPGPSGAETAAARARLLKAIDDPQAGTSRLMTSWRRAAALEILGRRKLWAPVAAAAAVTAVAITAAVIAAPGPQAARPASSSGSVTAASLLREAATAAARQAPGHGRYFATEYEVVGIYTHPPRTDLRFEWAGDGVSGRVAWVFGSTVPGAPTGIPFGNRLLTWAQIQRLPTAPGQLRAAIAAVSKPAWPGAPPVATQFSLIANLLAGASGSPALRSALYQVAAGLPGLAVVPHARDLIGRAAAEAYVPFAIPDGSALYFSPSTGAVLDVAQPSLSPQCPDIWQSAVLASGFVSSKYQLPAGAVRTARPVPPLTEFPACHVTPPEPTPSPSAATPTRSPSATEIPSPTPTPVTSPPSTPIPSPTPTAIPSPSVTGEPSPTPGGPSPTPTTIPSPTAGGS